MLVDDACIFEGSVSLTPPSFAASRATTASTIHRLRPSSWLTERLYIRRPDVGQHSADLVEGLISVPSDETTVGSVPSALEIGYYAQRGPLLSRAARQRLVASLEEDAPERKLAEIRKLARQPEHSGITAYQAYRDQEQLTCPESLSALHARHEAEAAPVMRDMAGDGGWVRH